MDNQLVKLWVMDQITKITKKMDVGYIPPVVGEAKIEILRDFYETFSLDQVTTEVIYHNQV